MWSICGLFATKLCDALINCAIPLFYLFKKNFLFFFSCSFPNITGFSRFLSFNNFKFVDVPQRA